MYRAPYAVVVCGYDPRNLASVLDTVAPKAMLCRVGRTTPARIQLRGRAVGQNDLGRSKVITCVYNTYMWRTHLSRIKNAHRCGRPRDQTNIAPQLGLAHIYRLGVRQQREKHAKNVSIDDTPLGQCVVKTRSFSPNTSILFPPLLRGNRKFPNEIRGVLQVKAK